MRGFETVAQALWVFALIGWFVLIYFSFGVLTFTIRRMERTSQMEDG
jgi:hypothetical protein